MFCPSWLICMKGLRSRSIFRHNAISLKLTKDTFYCILLCFAPNKVVTLSHFEQQQQGWWLQWGESAHKPAKQLWFNAFATTSPIQSIKSVIICLIILSSSVGCIKMYTWKSYRYDAMFSWPNWFFLTNSFFDPASSRGSIECKQGEKSHPFSSVTSVTTNL